jgi:hypothetical protein
VRRRLHGQAEPGGLSGVAAGRRPRRIAGELGDLERTDDAARIREVDRGRKSRCRCGQPGDERRQAVRGQVGFEARTEGRVARECVGVEAACHSAKV